MTRLPHDYMNGPEIKLEIVFANISCVSGYHYGREKTPLNYFIFRNIILQATEVYKSSIDIL